MGGHNVFLRSVLVGGQRLFFNVKMGGQELFSKSDMGGHTLFSRTKMGGQGVFFYQNITDFPGDLPINFGHSLTAKIFNILR